MKSGLFKLNLSDFWKGFFLSILMAVLTVAYKLIENEGFNFSNQDYKEIGITAVLAALAYLTKNLTENNEGKTLKADRKD